VTSADKDAAWRAKVAEAARRAAADLAEDDAPQLRQLRADLQDLYRRLAAEPDSGS
jgi:hypothetical protein